MLEIVVLPGPSPSLPKIEMNPLRAALADD